MKSSGIKRGMAALAISAVAVTGLPAFTGIAFAESINNQVEDAFGPDDVVLFNSQFPISTKPDGTDSTVRLECGGGRNVEAVRFEYRLNPGGATFITIGDVTARNDDGAFSFEWANPPVGQTIDLRCVDITPLGAGDVDRANGIEVFGNDPNVETINVANDTNRGYYDSDATGCGNGINLIVNGTTSVQSTAAGDAPRLRWLEPGPAQGGQGDFTPRDVTFADITTPAGIFSGILDIQNYDFANDAGEFPDQIVVNAQTDVTAAGTRETEDLEAYTLYEQVITTVTVRDASTGNGGLPTEVIVTVTDQNGEPVAGAEVVQSSTGVTDITDSRGEAQFDQFTNGPSGTQGELYFADNDCNGTFQASQGDRTAPPFTAGATAASITIASNPEGRRPVVSTTTETVTIRDAAGNPIVGRQVRVTRTGPGASNQIDFFTTNAQGQVLFSVTCSTEGTINVEAAIQDPGGQGTPLPSDPYNVKATDTVLCGIADGGGNGTTKQRINPAIKGKNVNGGNDWVLVRAKAAAGASVKVFKVVGKNRRVLIDTGRLNGNGVFKNVYRDLNGKDLTVYKAVVGETATTQRGVTNRLQQPKIR